MKIHGRSKDIMGGSKIVIIGAGSHFTLGIFGDIFRTNDLWRSELVLVDIDEERLNVVSKFLMRVVKREKVQLEIRAHNKP